MLASNHTISGRSRTAFLAIAAAAALMLAGCSSTPSSMTEAPTNRGSFPELVQANLDDATSDFEKDVLQRAVDTGEITAADYEEAVIRYLSCTKDAGVDLDAVKQPNGIYVWKPKNVKDLEEYGQKTTMCADGTVMRIEGLYKLQVSNTGMLPNNEAAVKCLRDNNVAPAGYGTAQFDKDVESGFKDSVLDPKNELVQMCLTSIGYTIG